MKTTWKYIKNHCIPCRACFISCTWCGDIVNQGGIFLESKTNIFKAIWRSLDTWRRMLRTTSRIKGCPELQTKGTPFRQSGGNLVQGRECFVFFVCKTDRHAPLYKARIDEFHDPFTWHDDLTDTSTLKYNTLGSIAPSPKWFLSTTKLVLMFYTEFALRAFTRELNSNSLFHFPTISQYHNLSISRLHKSTILLRFIVALFWLFSASNQFTFASWHCNI